MFQPSDLLSELSFKTSRSGGAGGQNVNKVNSRVELTFNIVQSAFLDQDQKDRVIKYLGKKLTVTGDLRIVAQEDRSQHANKELAVSKFLQLISKALIVPKKRKPTKATKASKEKRLDHKKRRSEIKRMRSGS